jgi:hypothetical protein
MIENREEKPLIKRLRYSRMLRWGVGVPAVLALFLYIASFFLDEPIRRIMEMKINRNLKGYSVRLPGAHFQLIGLSLTLKGLTVLQQAHPDPPVVHFPVIKATIHWREILSGKLVAEVMLDQPKININLKQLRSEVASKIPLKERGWQQALEDIYPLKINTVTIKAANITYIDQDPKKPLVLSRFNLKATNIRNIHQPGQVYPSPFKLDTAIFDTGHGTVEGNANFLAEPYPGLKGHFTLADIPIDYFKTVIARSNLAIDGGLLQASGSAEYAPRIKNVHLANLTIQGMKLDYTHSKRTAVAEKKRADVVGKTARKLSNKPDILIRADQLNLTECTLGMINKAAKKPYRVFLENLDLQLSNFSNQFAQGPAQARLKAKFMGSGITTATANFRPENGGPDFDLHVKIEETQLTSMNNVLRSYGNFDVSAGVFALTTELHIKDGLITGYIKPFFKGMKVYDKRNDKDQGVFHQMYEMMVGGVAHLLENRTHQEVATKADIKGRVGNPETSTWQIVTELIKNAFFKAILPSFEKEVTGTGTH